MVCPEILVRTLDSFMWRHTFIEIVTPPSVGQIVKTHTDLCTDDLVTLPVETVE
jgi:hypothetical protein